jgi:predicted Rossmann fold nucleotide-binding protein DprA/Smf involved in DNA uptake
MADDLLERVRAEIDGRRAELHPHIAEYQRLLGAAEALGLPLGETGEPEPRARRRPPARSASGTRRPPGARATGGRRGRETAKPAVTPRARAAPEQKAIVAALEHGSHTVAELAVVTAMSAASIREQLRGLLAAGTVSRARREGKPAYALSAPGRG